MVFGVAEGLAGCHHDRVPGVNPERIEVLSNTAQQSGHAGGGGSVMFHVNFDTFIPLGLCRWRLALKITLDSTVSA